MKNGETITFNIMSGVYHPWTHVNKINSSQVRIAIGHKRGELVSPSAYNN